MNEQVLAKERKKRQRENQLSEWEHLIEIGKNRNALNGKVLAQIDKQLYNDYEIFEEAEV